MRENVCEGTFARERSRANVCEKAFSRVRSRGNVRDGKFARELSRRATEGIINVHERTFAKGDGGENFLKGMLARGDLQDHRSSSTGELYVIESVHCVVLIPNTRG